MDWAEIRFEGYADAAFFAAQRFFTASLMALRPAADSLRFGFAGLSAFTAVFFAGADSPLIFAHLSF